MALTRKFLAALGIEQEKIDEIIENHTATVDALKEERDKYKNDAMMLPSVQKELDELKEAAEKNKDNPYKAQYEELKKEYEDYKNGIEAKETKAKKVDAYKKMLKEINVSEKRLDAIIKVSNLDSIELDKDGNIKGVDDLKKTAQEEWSDFIVKERTEGADTKTPPTGGGDGNVGKSRAAQLATRHYENLYGSPNGGKDS